MTEIYDDSKIKVFLTSTDEDGNPIDSDLNKIKVTVTESLSKFTIAKLTQNLIPKSTEDDKTEILGKRTVPQHQSSTKNEPKRKNDLESAKLTISKKQKVAEKNGLPQTIQIDDHVNEICNQNTKTLTKNNAVAVLDYSLNEVVWGKIRGWPHWPARITAIEQRRFEVQWFNDYRKSKLFRTQLFKFFKNYDEFSKLFGQKVGLETAAKEAVIFLAHEANCK